MDIKTTRKLKLLSLHDNELKLKFINCNKRLIQISEDGSFHGTSGHSSM